MSYLLDAMQHLGIYYTPARILALGTGDGKTHFPVGNPPFQGGIDLTIEDWMISVEADMTIEITRPNGTFLYRQRADDPCVIESRPGYRGGRWNFVKRFDTEAEARAALMQIGREGSEGE